jgi:hypothetical protein
MQSTERRIAVIQVFTDEGLIGLGDIDGPRAGDIARVGIAPVNTPLSLLGQSAPKRHSAP